MIYRPGTVVFDEGSRSGVVIMKLDSMRLARGRLALCGACLGVLVLAGCIESENTLVSGLALKNFEQQGPLTIYNKNNLFDYIDGEAEIYFPLGFKLLYKQSYRAKKKGGTLIAVDVYEMETPRGAQGIFDKFADDEDSLIEGLADAAWADGFVLLLRDGRYFVRVMPGLAVDGAAQPTRKDLLSIGRALDKALTTTCARRIVNKR